MKRNSCKWFFAVLMLVFVVLIVFGVYLINCRSKSVYGTFMFMVTRNYFIAFLCVLLAGFFLIAGVFVLLLMPPERVSSFPSDKRDDIEKPETSNNSMDKEKEEGMNDKQ